MVLHRAPNAAKLAGQHLDSGSAWFGLTDATTPPTGLPDERSPEPQRQNLPDAERLERSWQAVSSPDHQRETSLSQDWQSGGQRNAEGTGHRSVLIIDDNDDNLLFAQYAVEHLGYRATALKSGCGAVATAMTCLPDIVLLDILLEHVNGIDVLHQLRKHEMLTHIPVIAVTALARPCDQASIMSAGFSDYLLKPYMINDLERMIGRHLPA